MKLRLTKSWYETRAKAEEGCTDIAAAASIRSIPTVDTSKAGGKKAASRSTSTGQSRTKRRAK